jgi:AGCS family alanine or glycine:cation symporter
MAWLNLIAILLLQNIALKIFHGYESQLRSGIVQATFNSEKLNITNTSEWK